MPWQSGWKTEKGRPESRRRIRKGLTISEKPSEEEVWKMYPLPTVNNCAKEKQLEGIERLRIQRGERMTQVSANTGEEKDRGWNRWGIKVNRVPIQLMASFVSIKGGWDCGIHRKRRKWISFNKQGRMCGDHVVSLHVNSHFEKAWQN